MGRRILQPTQGNINSIIISIMIEIINSLGEWEAYINNTLYASGKTLKALLAYLNAHVPELEQRISISYDNESDTCDY